MGYPRVPQRHNKQTAFLSALAKGKTPIEAAHIVGVPWSTFYTWRRKHTRFRKAWDKARAYGATPEFPPPATLAKLALAPSPSDAPVEIDYHDMMGRGLLSLKNVPLDPLPENVIVTNMPAFERPRITALIDAMEDPQAREAARVRWLSRSG